MIPSRGNTPWKEGRINVIELKEWNGMETNIFEIPFLDKNKCKDIRYKQIEIQTSFNSICAWFQNSHYTTRHNFQSRKYENISAL